MGNSEHMSSDINALLPGLLVWYLSLFAGVAYFTRFPTMAISDLYLAAFLVPWTMAFGIVYYPYQQARYQLRTQ